MKNSLMAIVASGLLCVSAASTAQTSETNTANVAADEAKPTKEKKICLTSNGDSGSNLKRTECRSRKDWKRLGVELGDDAK